MEESIIGKNNLIQPIDFGRSPKNEQKKLMRSRIKALKGRIFWSRNNSESSIEKIKVRLKQHAMDKLQQQRNRNLKMKDQLDFLVKKLSLPKLKDCVSSSLHCHSDGVKKLTRNNFQSQTIESSKVEKRKSVAQKYIDQVLFKYNKRCEEQIGLFSFGAASTICAFPKPQPNKLKDSPKNTQENSDCLPKQIVTYLRKFMR